MGVLDPDPTIAAMLRGKSYLYVENCTTADNKGFGISFEVPPTFHPLEVAYIAKMIDVSITVRHTHFVQNTFGNMGKIPAHWIDIDDAYKAYKLLQKIMEISRERHRACSIHSTQPQTIQYISN